MDNHVGALPSDVEGKHGMWTACGKSDTCADVVGQPLLRIGWIEIVADVRKPASTISLHVTLFDWTVDSRPIRYAVTHLQSFANRTHRMRSPVSSVWCLRNPKTSMVEAAITARLPSTS